MAWGGWWLWSMRLRGVSSASSAERDGQRHRALGAAISNGLNAWVSDQLQGAVEKRVAAMLRKGRRGGR